MEQPINDTGGDFTSMAAELADEAAAGVPDGGGGMGEKDGEDSAALSGPLEATMASVGDGETVAACAGASAAADLQGEEDGEQVGGDIGAMGTDSVAAGVGGGGSNVGEEVGGEVKGGVENLAGEDGSFEGKEENRGHPAEGMWRGEEEAERGKEEAEKAEAARDRELHGLEEEGQTSQGDGGSHGKDLEEGGEDKVSEACVTVEGIGEGVGGGSLKEELKEAAVEASREGDRGEAGGDNGGAEGKILVEAGGGGEGQLVSEGKPAAEGESDTAALAANTLPAAEDAAAATAAAAAAAAPGAAEEPATAATADKVAAVPASVDNGAAAIVEANAAHGSVAPDVAAPAAAPQAAAAAPLHTKPTDGPEADGEGEAPKGEKRKRDSDGDGEEGGAKKEKMTGEGGGRAVKDAVNLDAGEEEVKGQQHDSETRKAEEEDGDTYPEEGDEEHDEEVVGAGMQGKVEGTAGAADAAGGDEKVEGQKGKGAGKEGVKPPPPGSTALTTKDVRKMMGSPVLTKPNAVAHTMRKLIVFASLAIRQGLDDLLRLEFRHFRVIHRGEPYLSPASPGEHVLFDPPSSLAPDLIQKQFFPNPHNRYLCPVRLLDEESTMRPHNAPPALFLTVKYARAPSYEPLNRYVRNAMGRSTLGRFASLLGETAGLRSVGRRFFRALGVTIMFMAGFSTDEVLREARCSTSVLHALFRPDAAEAAAAAEQDRQHRQQQQQQKKGQVMAARGHKHHHHHDSKGGGEGLSFGLPSFGNVGDGGSGGGGDPLQSQLKTAQLLQQLQATQLMSAQLQAQLLASQLQTQQLQSALQQGGAAPAVVGGITAAGGSGTEGGEGGGGGGGGVGMGTNTTSTGTMGTSMGGMNTSMGAMPMTPMQAQQGMGSNPSMPMVTPPPVLPAPGSNFGSGSAMPSPSSGSGMGGPMAQSGMYQMGPGGVGQSSNAYGANPGMGDSGSLLQPMQQQLYNNAPQQQQPVQFGAGMPSTGGGGGGASSYTAQLQGTYSSSIGSGLNGRIA